MPTKGQSPDKVSKKEFDAWIIIDSRYKTYNQRIVGEFLQKNTGVAFSNRGVAKGTGLSSTAVNHVLLKFKHRGLVEHKTPYWRWKCKN